MDTKPEARGRELDVAYRRDRARTCRATTFIAIVKQHSAKQPRFGTVTTAKERELVGTLPQTPLGAETHFTFAERQF